MGLLRKLLAKDVKVWPKGAKCAAQSKDNIVTFFTGDGKVTFMHGYWVPDSPDTGVMIGESIHLERIAIDYDFAVVDINEWSKERNEFLENESRIATNFIEEAKRRAMEAKTKDAEIKVGDAIQIKNCDFDDDAPWHDAEVLAVTKRSIVFECKGCEYLTSIDGDGMPYKWQKKLSKEVLFYKAAKKIGIDYETAAMLWEAGFRLGGDND